MVPSRFFFRNIRFQQDFFLCSCDMSSFNSGIIASYSCRWFISVNMASFPFSANFLIPCLKLICVIMTCACGFANFLLADCCPSCVKVYLLFLSVGWVWSYTYGWSGLTISCLPCAVNLQLLDLYLSLQCSFVLLCSNHQLWCMYRCVLCCPLILHTCHILIVHHSSLDHNCHIC